MNNRTGGVEQSIPPVVVSGEDGAPATAVAGQIRDEDRRAEVPANPLDGPRYSAVRAPRVARRPTRAASISWPVSTPRAMLAEWNHPFSFLPSLSLSTACAGRTRGGRLLEGRCSRQPHRGRGGSTTLAAGRPFPGAVVVAQGSRARCERVRDTVNVLGHSAQEAPYEA